MAFSSFSKKNTLRGMLHVGVACLVAAVFFCCKNATDPPSLSEEKVARIMADMATADAAVNLLSGYTKDSTAKVYYQQVLDMNGTTLDEYERNLRIMATDVQRMQRIAKQAEQILEAKK
jgi:Domain of unknown function (DUF4296)